MEFVMIKPPKHPVGPDFDKARDWMNQQERLLTEAQQRDYDKLKEQQAKERQTQQHKLDQFKKELEQKSKLKRDKAELVYNPPIKTADPNIKRLAQNTIAASNDLETLNQNHKDQRIKALEAFASEREETEKNKEKASNNFKASWKTAVEKTTARMQEQDRQRNLSKDFDKSR